MHTSLKFREAFRWGLFFISFFIFPVANSQVAISYPSVAEDITSNFGDSKLTVKISFASTCTPSDNQLQLRLPQGVEYIPHSIGAAASLSSLNLSELDITDLRQPIFKFSGTGKEGTFVFKRKAGCVTGTNFKDSIEIIGASCTNLDFDITKNNYNIKEAALTVISPTPIINATIGMTDTRTVKIMNGGNGAIDTVYFYVAYPGGAIENNNGNKITIAGTDFLPTSVNGDTLFYKIYGSSLFNGDQKLDPNETIDITEPIVIKKCNLNATIYNVGWGENKAVFCQSSSSTGTVTMVEGAANFSTAPVVTESGYINYCSPFQQKVVFKNNGAGSQKAAAMYKVKIQMGYYSTGNNWGATGFSFKISNVRVNGQPIPFSGSNTTTYQINLANYFTSDPDGSGGLTDLDGDGFYDDLPAGETLEITWDIELDCSIACGVQIRNIIGYVMKYDDMCGNPVTSIVKSGSTYVSESGFGSTSYFPPNIVDGGVYTFDFNYASQGNTNTYFGTNGRYEYRLVLPPGLSVAPTPNAKYNGIAVGYTMSGDTVIIRSPENALRAASIDLIYHCGASGVLPLWHTLLKINEPSANCNCSAQQKFCSTIYTSAQCPGPCPEGPTTYQPIARRTDGSLGWTDQTMTTRQSASAISAYDLSKALYLDTIQITSGAIQNDATSNLHLRLELPKTTSGNISKLNPVDLKMEIWRAGSKVYENASSIASDMSVNPMQKIDWNLNLPAGGLQAGDSIFSISRYIVATNTGLPLEDVQSGDKWFYYNNNAGVEVHCNEWIPEMYLVGTNMVIGTNTSNLSGCTELIPGSGFGYLARRFGPSGQEYLSEFRPSFYIDSIVFTKTDGYDLISADLVSNSGYFGALATLTLPLTPTSVNGNTYKYVNDGSWRVFGIRKQNGYGGNFRVRVASNCQTDEKEIFQTKIYVKDYYYAFGNPNLVPSVYKYPMRSGASNYPNPSSLPWNYTMNYAPSTKPDITIQNTTGTVQITEGGSHYWDVKLSNNSIGTAPYVWLAFEKGTGSGNLIVTSVEDLTNGGTLTSVGSYSCSGTVGYQWYKFSTAGLSTGASNTFRIHFTTNYCNPDSLLLKAGWNCNKYPTSPCDYTCGAEEVYLKVKPEQSEIQLSIEHQPNNGNKMDLCVEDYISILVNSTQGADLLNPYLTFVPPTGMSINTGNIKVEYPLNSGNIQSPIITTVGGEVKIDLKGHNLIDSKGILGVMNASNSNESVALVTIPFALYCDYISGKSVSLKGFGSAPCGGPAIGNGKSSTTNSIKINGVPEDGGATMSFLTPGPVDFECDQVTMIESSTTTFGVTSQTGDTLVYTLPSGITYDGAFSSIPALTGAVVINGNQVLVPVPAGKNSLTVQFNVKSDCENCNNNAVVVSYQREIEGLSCGGVDCAGSKSEIAASAIAIDCYDPLPINLVDFTATSNNCDITINWTTATERNNAYFEIYRSEDLSAWAEIARVTGAGNSSTRIDYHFVDRSVRANDVYYYYLKQVDFDGESEEFAPVSVLNSSCNQSGIDVYPNPTKDEYVISLPFTIEKSATIQLMDVSGKVISMRTVTTHTNAIYNSMENLQAGVYQLKVIVDGNNFPMVKVVKM